MSAPPSQAPPSPPPSPPSPSSCVYSDRVVREIDVYITNKLSPSIALVQFPLRPAWRPYDSGQVVATRFKSVQKKFEMELTMPEGETYDDNVLTLFSLS